MEEYSLEQIVEELNGKLDNETDCYIRNMKVLMEFNLTSCDKIISKIQNKEKMCGIYYFKIKFNDEIKDDENKAEVLIENWNSDKREHIPPIIKKNIDNMVVRKGKWIPFYVGKCADIYKRLNEHLIGKSTTSSLRLNEISNGIFKNADYKVMTINLEQFNEDNYWVVAKIEKNIRGKLKPICGR